MKVTAGLSEWLVSRAAMCYIRTPKLGAAEINVRVASKNINIQDGVSVRAHPQSHGYELLVFFIHAEQIKSTNWRSINNEADHDVLSSLRLLIYQMFGSIPRTRVCYAGLPTMRGKY